MSSSYRDGSGRPVQSIGQVMPVVMERLERIAQAGDVADPPRVVTKRQDPAKSPLRDGAFTSYPVPLDAFAVRLALRPGGRHCAAALTHVALDLARYTDNVHHDCIVSNNGIASRRPVGTAAVKATVKLLVSRGVLTKTTPSPARREELKRAPGGFNSTRRYLVWNPRSKWRLPESEEGLDMLIDEWNQYVGKTERAERVYG